MSTMIDWPYKPLPGDAHKPPYTFYAIDGEPLSEKEFPPRVPLGLVLHFAPILENFMVDVDTGLPVAEKRAVLDKEFVGFNLPGSIPRLGINAIVRRMVQLSGLAMVSPQDFDVTPCIDYALQIVTAWRNLQLPKKGTERLEFHLFAALTSGPPVSEKDIKRLWELYPPPSFLMKEAALNFFDAYIKAEYRGGEAARIRAWVQSDPQIKDFFAQNEAEYKFRAQKENLANRPPVPPPTIPNPMTGPWSADNLSPDGTERDPPAEEKDRLKKDSAGKKQRIRRLKRDPPLRSIYDEDEEPRSTRSASAGPSGRPRSGEIGTHPRRVISFSDLGREAGDELSKVLESLTQDHRPGSRGESPLENIELYWV